MPKHSAFLGRAAAVLAAVAVVALPAAASDRRVAATAPGTWETTYDWSAGNGFAGWHSVVSAPAGQYGASTGAGGLALAVTGGGSYGPGWIEWEYDAPGTTTIRDAAVTVAAPSNLYAHHCVSVRLQTNGQDNAVQNTCKPIDSTFAVTDPAAGSTALVIRLEFPACKDATSPSCTKEIPDPLGPVTVPLVHLTLKDVDAPAIALSGALPALADHFVDGTASYAVNAVASDSGSGVRSLWLDVPAGATFATADATCDSTHSTPALGGAICPPTLSLDAGYDTTKLPEGPSVLGAHARDVASNVGDRSWTLYVDRTPPTLTATGDLADLAGHFVDGTKTYSIALAAADPGVAERKASGIARVWVEHGPTADDSACTDLICPPTFASTLTVDTSSFAEGTNTIAPTTRDLVGHVTAAPSWPIYVDRTAPTPSAAGAFANLAGTYIGGTRAYGITLNATDPGADAHAASGVRRLRLVPGATVELPCGALACAPSASADTTVDTTGFPEGTNTFHVEATDLVGHTGVSGNWTVYVDRTPPTTPQDVALYARDQIGWDPSTDAQLADGTPGAGVTGYAFRTRIGNGAWSSWHTVSTTTVEVAGANDGDTIGVQVHAIDAAGNESADANATLTVPAATPAPIAEDATNPPPADDEAGDLVQPWTDPVLSGGQESDASSIASADPQVAAILAAGSATADDTSAWRADREPTLLGATVHYSFAQPTTVNGAWSIVTFDDADTYTVVPTPQTLPDVTGFTVDVDLAHRKVVAIEPETSEDAATVVRRTLSLVRGYAAKHGLSRRVQAEESASGGRATSSLRPICIDAGLCFYNYDFDTKNAAALKNERYRHVDMPVTMIYYGNANVHAVNAGLQSFEPGSGNPMQGRVWDRSLHTWYDDTNTGRKVHSCDFWKHIEHTRFYGDSSGSLFSVRYGYVVVATTHRDWYECLPFVTSHSGESEQGEKAILDGIEDPVQVQLNPALAGWKVKADAVNLHNKEGWPNSYSVGSHPLHNDGLASLVWLPGGPVDADGNPPPCTTCEPPKDNDSGAPTVEVTTRKQSDGYTWVSWNSYEAGPYEIAFCRAKFEPLYDDNPVRAFTIDTGPAGGPQLWHLGRGNVWFTCWDTHSPQRTSYAVDETW